MFSVTSILVLDHFNVISFCDSFHELLGTFSAVVQGGTFFNMDKTQCLKGEILLGSETTVIYIHPPGENKIMDMRNAMNFIL